MSKDGTEVDPKEIQAVGDWPKPTNLNEIQQSLGLTKLFRKFPQGYSNLTGPLIALLRKNTPFSFSTACQGAFAGLKTALHVWLCRI